MTTDIVDIHYARSGQSTKTDALGMREMQARAYAERNRRFLLIKAPPASGKSRALMFIALDKLEHQGLRKAIVAVPEKSIGGSFANTQLRPQGFFADWTVAPYFNLVDTGDEHDKTGRFCEFMLEAKARTLVCTHATLRTAMQQLPDSAFDNCLLAIDEFHHTSADARSNLGEAVRRVMNNTSGHIVAMTGSYFRGDGIPVLRPEDEARFFPVTYNYYQQLNGYEHLKSLVLGYHFYSGSYLDHVGEVLDTTKKTIVHIPNVNSRASTGSKHEEVRRIMQTIGTVEQKDYNNCIYLVRTPDGRLLKVADLVEDQLKERNLVQGYLQRVKRRDDMDIIIALGTAKEGFDWPWCEMCLTIGVRGSLTEVVQIIGRCTRDCEGKDTARFVNMIAMPDAEIAEVRVAVNDFLKAVTASLLMEQVMAPNWNFRTKAEAASVSGGSPDGSPATPSVVIDGLKPITTARTRQIVQEQLDDLIAAILQDDLTYRALSDGTTAETVTRHLIPKVIRQHYPDLTEDEEEVVREHVLLNLHFRGQTPPSSTDDDSAADGERFVRLGSRFVNIDKLSINLIDHINPFQRAYEIVSKHVDAPTLKVIQDCIAEQRINLTLEQAIDIFNGSLKEYVREHGGQRPSLNDPSPRVREMAAALAMLREHKMKMMREGSPSPDAPPRPSPRGGSPKPHD